ncbi:MAG: polymerase, sigma 29 subunit, SigE [Mycobacterium sp.]|nr:polymerase, sigma 29 subunit, SigE [Mycobacterium sp.]
MTAGTICAPGGRSYRSRPLRRGLTLGALTRKDDVPVSAAASTWQPPSWDEVVREHSARVYRLAYRLTGNQHDAEDLTQDVFIRVFKSLDGYTPGTFEGWLHRITTNLFLDRMRRASRIRFEALPDDAERLPGREATPEAALVADLFDPDVERALASLPPDFRAAVVLCDVEQLSYEEIAATLNVKLGTVRSRISRGRAMLRAALADRAPASNSDFPRRTDYAREAGGASGEIASQEPGVAPVVVR